MPAIVTDQFRILNANNFVESVENTNNSYYVFVGLANPKGAERTNRVGFGRTTAWNDDGKTPAPVDSFSYRAHAGDTMSFGKKVSSANIRRIIRRVDWVQGQRYEIYRDDYSASNQSPITTSNRLYDAKYYVLNSDFKVYVCIDNGSSGTNTLGNVSQDEPTFTDLEPSKAGNSGDGFVWKYLFSISPSDIVKFDSTEYITVPNNWATSTDSQIRAVRENGDSSVNNNQIKHVYIDKAGENYTNGLGQEVDILGDGTGGKARVDVVDGKITNVTVSSGGKGYSYALIDLQNIAGGKVSSTQRAKLIPIIPPKLGHGSDIYTELGTDKVIVYARFDDSTNDFPVDTQFSQVGIVKNPTKIDTSNIFTEQTFSALQGIKFDTVTGTPDVGEELEQTLSISPNVGQKAVAYIASFDKNTKVLKYFRDRSLNYAKGLDQTDFAGISTIGRIYQFESSSSQIKQSVNSGSTNFSGSVDTSFNDSSTTPSGGKLVNLGVQFTGGLSQPEINKGSGEIIYLDNRPIIVRNSRQKEDIKIILEF